MFTTAAKYLSLALDAIKTHVLNAAAAGITVKLAQAPFNPNPNSVPGDFTEATYTGYAPVVLTTFSADRTNGTALETIATALALFQPTGTAVTNVIAGYWIEDSAGNLLGYDTIVPNKPMGTPTDSITVTVAWQQQPQQWSNVLVP